MNEAEHQPRELSSFFSDSSSEAAPAATAAEPVAEAPPSEPSEPSAEAQSQPETIGQSRVPKGAPGAGQFAPKDGADETGGDGAAAVHPTAAAPTPEAAPEGSPPSEAPVPQAALMGERRRRQQAEERTRFLEQQLQAVTRLPQAQPPTSEPQKVDFWDDPDTALAARFDQFGSQLLERFEQRQIINHVNKSELAARSRYEDFDEVISAFQQVANTDLALAQEMAAADDPAEFAYRKGKSLAEIHSYGGDINALLAAKRAEWEAELRASAPSPSPSLPPSTATERSVTVPRSGPEWSGPRPLSAFFQT